GNAFAKRRDDRRMIRKAIVFAAHGSQAVRVDDLATDPAVAVAPVPGQRARSVSRRFYSSQHRIAEADHLAVVNDVIDPRGGERRKHAGLWIVGPRAACPQHRRGRWRSVKLGAGHLLQSGDATNMVDMLMAVEDDPNIVQAEPKFLNIVGDQVR